MYIIQFIMMLVGVNSYGWVPLIDLKTYDTKKLSSIKILNKELVIWEKNKNIIVQDNACIHRKAPLSEGYIDKNTKNLCCSYHGWEYLPNGCVNHIPQMDKPVKQCYKQNTYTTICHNNILWLNLDESKDIYNKLPDHITEINNVCDDTIVVELPYSMNILLENFFDPAHIPFAHHNLQSKRELASCVYSKIIHMNKDKIEFYFEDNTLLNKQFRNGTMTFHNPNHYELNTLYPDSTFIESLQIYCVPVENHKTRIFMQQKYKKNFYKNIYNNIPDFIKHILTLTFLDSDTMLLYKQQEELLKSNSFNNSIKSYITPTSSDYSVLTFHKWLNKYNPVWLQYIKNETYIPQLSRNQVLDRYESHTKNCIYCRSTLKNIKMLQVIIPLLFFIYNIYINTSLLSITCGIISFWFFKYSESHFIFRDYIHNKLK